jgi:hypothetical protein
MAESGLPSWTWLVRQYCRGLWTVTVYDPMG